MKEGLSGSIINEIEVNERWESQRNIAIQLILKFKRIECEKPKKIIRVNAYTFKSENFDELMQRKKEKRPIFKRRNE